MVTTTIVRQRARSAVESGWRWKAATRAAVIARMTRSNLIEVLQEDYVRTARAKGLRETAVVVRHALKNALIPVITLLGIEVAAVIGGAVILEQIFVLPGMGQLLIEAVSLRDYPLITGIFLGDTLLQVLGLVLMGVVDTLMVGHLSAGALAAVALGNLLFYNVAAFAIDAVERSRAGVFNVLSPPGRFSSCPCNCLKASGISVNGAPLRRAPGLRWITAR